MGMVARDLNQYIELLKNSPITKRFALLENLRSSQRLTQDECLIIIHKAENRSDSEIEEERRRIRDEKEIGAIFNHMNGLGSSGSISHPDIASNENLLVKIAKVTNIRSSGKSLQDSFIEVFSLETYEEIMRDLD
jgi:hypothetical protein